MVDVIRRVPVAAMVLPLWFWSVYLVMASTRPEYSHLTKAISELGSVDAPNPWVWNILGYIIPGLVIALLGLRLGDVLRGTRRARVASFALVASGLFMSLSGVFPGDFDDRTSATMIMHAVGSLGSFAGFLVAGAVYPFVFGRFPAWRRYAWPSAALVVLSVLTGFLRTGDAPGLGQRLGFFCFFAWIGLVGVALSLDSRRPASR
jgi:hypothetical membrane protein